MNAGRVSGVQSPGVNRGTRCRSTASEDTEMPAETKLFRCLKDNYGVLHSRPRERRDRRDRRAGGRAGRGRAQGHRLEAHRHPGDAPSRRPHRRHRRAEAEIQLPRGGAEGRGRQNSAGRRDGARGRQGQRRQADGQRDRNARPHRRPHHLLVSRRQARLRRRHAVLDRLRPRDRGHAGDDVGVAEEAARSAGRHAGLLRPRIHAGEHQVRADHRAGQQGARRRAPRRRRSRSRTDKWTIPTTIDEEKAANPFLRADVPAVAAAVGLAGKPAAEVFAEVRARKNKF